MAVFCLFSIFGLIWIFEMPFTSDTAKTTAFRALKNKLGKLPARGTFIIVDFSKPSQTKRFSIINMATGKRMGYGRVAHGKNSGCVYARYFSNVLGSNKSSVGLFAVGKRFNGRHGPSFRLHGLETKLNGNAEKRGIILHSGSYVSLTSILLNWREWFRLGRSAGCFVFSNSDFQHFLKYIKRPAYLYAFNGQTETVSIALK
jgi:hypothetical protein